MGYADDLELVGRGVDDRLNQLTAEREQLHADLAAALAKIVELENEPPPDTPPPVEPAANGELGMMVFLNPAEPAVYPRDLDELVKTGAAWIRIGIPEGASGYISGGRWQPHLNNMNYFTDCAKRATDAGLKVVLVMANALNRSEWSDEQHRTHLAQYCEHVAGRLGQHVSLWQVYNEHDGRDYRSYAPTDLTPQYLDRFRTTLAQARTALRSKADAPVTTTPFGYPVNQARLDKWKKFFDGIGSSLDVIGIHAYPEKTAAIIGLVPTYMRQIGARYNKPVAMLEYGLPSVPGYGTHEQVGQAVVDQTRAVMSADPFCATLFQLRDRGTQLTNGEMRFGILNSDYTRKVYYNPVVAEVRAWRKNSAARDGGVGEAGS